MLIKCVEYENISHSVTLVPRLGYSVTLLSEIAEILEKKRALLTQSNKDLVLVFDENNKTHHDAISLEYTMVFCLEVLALTKMRIVNISDINSITKILPLSIPMIRTISAQLFDVDSFCSQKLSELSVHLGSIVLDSATLTKARFDFSQSNQKSATLLDKVKLMVDSKISKQYPNLDFFKS
ncbi:MAG: hypothetical protein ACE5GR_06915 [Nitrosopumilus sp.]